MLDIAPAIDLSERRPELRVRRAQPLPERLDRTRARIGAARDRNLAYGVTAERELDDGRGEAQSLDVETDQRDTPEPSGHQQQQGSIAQPGEIPGASRRHANQLGGPRGRGARRAPGASPGLPENGSHGRIGGGGSETSPAVLVGDGGDATAQRAIAQPFRGGAEKGRHGRRVGGKRVQARLVAPGCEGVPVGSVRPHRLGCARASESRRRALAKYSRL